MFVALDLPVQSFDSLFLLNHGLSLQLQNKKCPYSIMITRHSICAIYNIIWNINLKYINLGSTPCPIVISFHRRPKVITDDTVIPILHNLSSGDKVILKYPRNQTVRRSLSPLCFFSCLFLNLFRLTTLFLINGLVNTI